MMTLRRTLHSIVAIAGAVMAKDKAEPPIARISLGRQPQCRASEARTEVKSNSERTRSPNAQSRGALLVVTVRRLSDRSGDDGVDKVRASTSFRSDCTALRSAKLLAAASELPGCSRYSACPAAPACNQVTTMISCPTTMSCSPSAKRGLTSSQASGAPSEPCLDAPSRLFISAWL